MYTKEEEAIRLVVKAFEGMKRQKEDINLSIHSILVGNLLKNNGCSSDVVISGYLHDIIEDTEYDYDFLVNNFGKEIADNVAAVSEDTSITNWRDRKEAFIKSFDNKSNDVIYVEMADKLHNLLSDYHVWLEKGKDGLATKGADYEGHKWFYLEMKKLFNSRLSNDKLLDRYNEICDIYFK